VKQPFGRNSEQKSFFFLSSQMIMSGIHCQQLEIVSCLVLIDKTRISGVGEDDKVVLMAICIKMALHRGGGGGIFPCSLSGLERTLTEIVRFLMFFPTALAPP
jgi:hypothetical protein